MTPDNALSLNVYSDIGADDAVAKMCLYTMRLDERDVASHPLSAFCTEFASI